MTEINSAGSLSPAPIVSPGDATTQTDLAAPKILIVDGSNLLFQMFFGTPARIIGANGKAIQGTLGFVGALLKIICMIEPTHVAVLFDGESHNPRMELSADYKANRPDYSQVEDDENPFSQLPDIYAALDYLHIPHAETTDCEADDWISGYAMTYGVDCDMILSSFDSDFYQLITDRIHILRYRGDKSQICDPNYIRIKLGIRPDQYADYKSLTGDTADNIRGAYKVGPKTAAALLQEYGTLEALLTQAETIRKPAVRESILQDRERLRINYQLIKLQGCETLPFTLDQLEYRYPGVTTTEVLKAIGLR